VLSGLALRKVGKFGRFFSIVKQLIERNFHSSRQLFKRFDRWNRMAVLNTRNVATEQASALLDVPLREFLFLAQGSQSISYYHVGILSPSQCFETEQISGGCLSLPQDSPKGKPRRTRKRSGEWFAVRAQRTRPPSTDEGDGCAASCEVFAPLRHGTQGKRAWEISARRGLASRGEVVAGRSCFAASGYFAAAEIGTAYRGGG